MKGLHACGAVVAVAVAGALPLAPATADDQAIQSVLLRLQCVPSKLARTELAAGIVSYEVTCKGRADVVFVVCHKTDCRQQTKRLNDVEKETPF